MQLSMLPFEKKLQKCIRMGITVCKIFIWRGISSDIWSEITFRLRTLVAVKLNFRPYIRRYTFPNEKFECKYPVIDLCIAEVLPLVEFVLEDGITDEEAIQILDLSIPKQKKEEKNWQESRMGGILLFK